MTNGYSKILPSDKCGGCGRLMSIKYYMYTYYTPTEEFLKSRYG